MQSQDPPCISSLLTLLSTKWWFSTTFACFSCSHPWTCPHATNSTHACCFFVLSLILHNSYPHTPTHLLLPPGPQPLPDESSPTGPCTCQRNMKPKLKLSSLSLHLCFAHWSTQFGVQIADKQWLHLLLFASQRLANIMDENPSCPVCISGKFRCSCPVSLWTPKIARWPVTPVATWVWEHLISEERLCLKQIVPQEKWSAWKCT